jgi:hypothetical protein
MSEANRVCRVNTVNRVGKYLFFDGERYFQESDIMVFLFLQKITRNENTGNGYTEVITNELPTLFMMLWARP